MCVLAVVDSYELIEHGGVVALGYAAAIIVYVDLDEAVAGGNANLVDGPAVTVLLTGGPSGSALPPPTPGCH